MTEIHFGKHMYRTEDGPKHNIDAFIENVWKDIQGTINVEGGELYTSQIMIEQLQEDDDIGFAAMNTYLWLKNMKNFFFKGWTPKKNDWHAFEY